MIVSRLSFRSSRGVSSAILAAALLVFGNAAAFAQQQDQQNLSAAPPESVPSRLVEPIDENVVVTLKGNVRQDAVRAPDLGAVEDGMPLQLFLLLQRSPAQQADLENLIARQQQPGAPEYHKWLTPAEFGARFGASPEDIATLSTWLESHGFQIRSVLNNASMIDFAGTAGQVREAFHTQMHYVGLQGGKYPALLQDPQIPAALAPVVAGIMGLNKIPLHANHTPPRQASYDKGSHGWQIVNPTSEDMASPAYSTGSGYYNMTPQDFYTIYKVNPVFTGGNLAATATVAVIEESDIEYGTVNSTTGAATGGDVATFRSLFGVPGTLNMHVYHGYGTVSCTDPGIDPSNNGEDEEASLDAEWANALAPSANLIFMSCASTTEQGIFNSMAALIDNGLSDVMSLSYGGSELNAPSSEYTLIDSLYAQAATQGQSILISTGDSASDVADRNASTATNGFNVNALSSSPLVTATGGTDFQDLYDAYKGGSAQSTYWSSTNSSYYGDALSYVPEMTWDDSCASSILAAFEGYTGAGYCATGNYLDLIGGSGGISTHYAVPSWQTGTSGYSNSMRAQPDISGFASNGFWGHLLIFCDSNPAYSGSYACSSASTFGGEGGTSFVAPYMAGVFGLLRTATGERQGVLNPALYALAKAQYTNPSTQTACYANGQSSNTGVTTGLPAAGCIFNDITTSNNDVPCASGSKDCYVNSGQPYGMLSVTGSSSLTAAYPSTVGFDQSTGLGSINIANLIADWNTAFTSSTALMANPTTINSTQSTQLTATVTGGTPTGYVDTPPALTGTATFKAGTTVVGSCTLSGGTCSTSVPGSSLQSGANSMTAVFGGSGTYPSSTSSIVTVTVQNGTPTPLTPYIEVNNGAWQQTASVAVNVGDRVNLAPLNINGGSWSWTGPNGFSASTREIDGVALPSASNVYTVTYTNTSGANSTQAFTVTVNATAVVPWLEVNGGAWQQASTVAVNLGATVNLAGQNISGGTWHWTGPNGFTASTREIDGISLPSGSNVYNLTYTNTAGAASSPQAFTITVNPTPLTPYVEVNGGAWQQASTKTVNVGDKVNLAPLNISGGSWSWTGPNGFSASTREVDNIPLNSASNSFTVTYTNTSGVNSTQTFTITVNPTPLTPYVEVNGGAWQQASAKAVNVGDKVNLAPLNISGGSWSWTGPNGFSASTREVDNVPLNSASNSFTVTYTNTSGVNSTQTFTITVNPTPLTPYIEVNGGAWQQASAAAVNVGDKVSLAPLNISGGSWSWTGPSGFSASTREVDNVPLNSASNSFTVTYTNTSGVNSTQAFTITVNATAVVPWIEVNGGTWQQTASATVTTGATVNLAGQNISGGSWSWTGPNGFTSTSREIDAVALASGTNAYTLKYTNVDGIQSSGQAFTITVN